MFINRKGIICHIAKTDKPYRLWYHINLLIPRFGEDYIEEKLGIIDPDDVQKLQDEFLAALQSVSSGNLDILENHSFRYNKFDWDFYLADKTDKSVTVFLESGLAPEDIESSNRHPSGYVWAVIEKSDTLEEVREKLRCNRKAFAEAFYKKLREMMGW